MNISLTLTAFNILAPLYKHTATRVRCRPLYFVSQSAFSLQDEPIKINVDPVSSSYPARPPPPGLAPVPIGSLKTDFTNIPPGTRLTVGSILFSKLELPPETNAAVIAACGAEEQLKTRPAAAPAAASARANGEAANEKGNGKVEGRGGGEAASEDSFSRIEIRVGRITKVRK